MPDYDRKAERYVKTSFSQSVLLRT